MDNLQSSNETGQTSTEGMHSGSVGAPAALEPPSVEKPLETDVKSPVAAPDQPISKEQFRYEFSLKVDNTFPLFCVIYDTNIASAVERVICEEQTMPIAQNIVTGIWFFEHKGIKYAIKVDPITLSSSFRCSETETTLTRTTKLKPKVAEVLQGLI